MTKHCSVYPASSDGKRRKTILEQAGRGKLKKSNDLRRVAFRGESRKRGEEIIKGEKVHHRYAKTKRARGRKLHPAGHDLAS